MSFEAFLSAVAFLTFVALAKQVAKEDGSEEWTIIIFLHKFGRASDGTWHAIAKIRRRMTYYKFREQSMGNSDSYIN